MFSSVLKKLFGNQSERAVRPLWNRLNNEINPISEQLTSLSHDELRGRIDVIRDNIRGNARKYKDRIAEIRSQIDSLDYDKREPLWKEIDDTREEMFKNYAKDLDAALPEVFAVVKETARRFANNETIEVTATEADRQLALQGKDVTIVEMKDDLVSQKGVCLANSSYLREWFAWKQVPVYLETTLREVKDGSIVCAAKDGTSVEIPCDTVISSAGYISTPLVEEKGHKNVQLVGDCLRVGNLRSVVWRAYEAAMKI